MPHSHACDEQGWMERAVGGGQQKADEHVIVKEVTCGISRERVFAKPAETTKREGRNVGTKWEAGAQIQVLSVAAREKW